MKSYKPAEGDSTMIESPDGAYILKKDILPILETYNKIKENILNEKESIITFVIEFIEEQTDYQKLMKIPFEEIALHINEYDKDSYEFHFLSCRLSKEDPFKKDLCRCITLLHNQSFNYEEYKSIGSRDGIIHVISPLLKLMGLDKDAEDLYEALYSD